jgi:hypothetical protein
MYEVLQSARTPYRRIELEYRSGFKLNDQVWVKALDKAGVVYDVLLCRSPEGECCRLQVVVVGAGLFNVAAGPVAVETLPTAKANPSFPWTP